MVLNNDDCISTSTSVFHGFCGFLICISVGELYSASKRIVRCRMENIAFDLLGIASVI